MTVAVAAGSFKSWGTMKISTVCVMTMATSWPLRAMAMVLGITFWQRFISTRLTQAISIRRACACCKKIRVDINLLHLIILQKYSNTWCNNLLTVVIGLWTDKELQNKLTFLEEANKLLLYLFGNGIGRCCRLLWGLKNSGCYNLCQGYRKCPARNGTVSVSCILKHIHCYKNAPNNRHHESMWLLCKKIMYVGSLLILTYHCIQRLILVTYMHINLYCFCLH